MSSVLAVVCGAVAAAPADDTQDELVGATLCKDTACEALACARVIQVSCVTDALAVTVQVEIIRERRLIGFLLRARNTSSTTASEDNIVNCVDIRPACLDIGFNVARLHALAVDCIHGAVRCYDGLVIGEDKVELAALAKILRSERAECDVIVENCSCERFIGERSVGRKVKLNKELVECTLRWQEQSPLGIACLKVAAKPGGVHELLRAVEGGTTLHCLQRRATLIVLRTCDVHPAK